MEASIPGAGGLHPFSTPGRLGVWEWCVGEMLGASDVLKESQDLNCCGKTHGF